MKVANSYYLKDPKGSHRAFRNLLRWLQDIIFEDFPLMEARLSWKFNTHRDISCLVSIDPAVSINDLWSDKIKSVRKLIFNLWGIRDIELKYSYVGTDYKSIDVYTRNDDLRYQLRFINVPLDKQNQSYTFRFPSHKSKQKEFADEQWEQKIYTWWTYSTHHSPFVDERRGLRA